MNSLELHEKTTWPTVFRFLSEREREGSSGKIPNVLVDNFCHIGNSSQIRVSKCYKTGEEGRRQEMSQVRNEKYFFGFAFKDAALKNAVPNQVLILTTKSADKI